MNSTESHEEAPSPLKYLTVQDMLWINLQVTKKVQHFNYARLEEATFYQYGYGASKDLARQAGRFFSGFLKLHPFDAGNEATGFIGCAAFLLLNGSTLNVPDNELGSWVGRVASGQIRAEEALPSLITNEHGHSLLSNVRAAVTEALNRFPSVFTAFSSAAA